MVETIKTRKRGKTFQKLQSIEPNTGEIKEILLIGTPEEFDTDFVKVFHSFTEKLLEDEEISGKSIRLLFWILKQLDYGSIEFYMNYTEVKKDLNIGKMTYYRWKKTLEKKGIIRKINTNLYQLNPSCIVKGKGHTLIKEFKKPNSLSEN